MKKMAMVLGVLAIFLAGFIAGGIYTKNSLALDLGGLTGMGQTVDSLKSLGKTIIEMEENVSKLQQNIESVKKVRDDISTYQGVYDRVMGVEQPAKPQPNEGVSPELQKGVIDLLNK